MNVPIVIAQFLGILFLGIGLSVVIDWKNLSAAIREISHNQGTLWMFGFITLCMGAVLIALNHAWTSGLALVITVFGWLALIKGLYLLIFPKSAIWLYEKCNTRGALLPGGIVACILGLVLLYAGLFVARI